MIKLRRNAHKTDIEKLPSFEDFRKSHSTFYFDMLSIEKVRINTNLFLLYNKDIPMYQKVAEVSQIYIPYCTMKVEYTKCFMYPKALSSFIILPLSLKNERYVCNIGIISGNGTIYYSF